MKLSGAARQGGTEQMTTSATYVHAYRLQNCPPPCLSRFVFSVTADVTRLRKRATQEKTRGEAVDMMTASSDDSPQRFAQSYHMLESLFLCAQVGPSMLAEFLDCQV
jgi:hypothetical protein